MEALLTVFYDASCRLCATEMDALRSRDVHGELAFVDCSRADFDDAAYRAEGVDRDAMMTSLYVRDVLGDWHRGVDAFALLYATVGLPGMARIWSSRRLRPLTTRLYRLLARHRQALSRLGLDRCAPLLRRWLARRAERHLHCHPTAACRPLAPTAGAARGDERIAT
jgi:predicted DCC family thiol-disulfide oxidoreductase YuxK